MSELADEVYSLCHAVVGGTAGAAAAAGAALRRGGWSRTMVLGHGAREALLAAAAPPPDDEGPTAPAPTPVVARWLAGRRPAEERAVLHLADRDGLAGPRLARALGRPEAEAAELVAAAAEAWAAHLDPALMAWLGPGGCPGLAGLAGPVTDDGADDPGGGAGGGGPDALTARGALALAPAVGAHVAGCPVCADRLRAMVSVRDLLAREPDAPAPPAVRALARTSRARPPTPLVAPGRPPVRRWRRPAAVVGVAALGAGGVVYLAWPAPAPDTPGTPPAGSLTRLPPGGSALVLTPPAARSSPLRLADVGGQAVSWQAASTAPWLQVAPAAGRLAPGQSVELALDVVGTPVPGLRATVTVNGSDGSVAAANYLP